MAAAAAAEGEERQELASPALESAVYADPNNRWCADCGAPDPDWASVSLGVVLCIQCCGVHRSLPPHISKVKSLKLDKWMNSEIESLRVVGNSLARSIYDARLACTHKRVSFHTPLGLRSYIIREKYGAGPAVEDVQHPAARQIAESAAAAATATLPPVPGVQSRQGWLQKKGKDSVKWVPRWFVLDNETLSYFACDRGPDGGPPESPGAPKETMPLLDTMVTLRSDKAFATKFGLQITYRKNHVVGEKFEFRNFFVSADSGEEVTGWLNDIRTNKAALLGFTQDMVGTPRGDEILSELSREVVREGWLQKTGPKGTGWKKRWVVILENRLLYYKSELGAIAQGNIVLDRFCTVLAVPERVPQNHCFIVNTGNSGGRSFLFQAETEAAADEWMTVIKTVCSARN